MHAYLAQPQPSGAPDWRMLDVFQQVRQGDENASRVFAFSLGSNSLCCLSALDGRLCVTTCAESRFDAVKIEQSWLDRKAPRRDRERESAARQQEQVQELLGGYHVQSMQCLDRALPVVSP